VNHCQSSTENHQPCRLRAGTAQNPKAVPVAPASHATPGQPLAMPPQLPRARCPSKSARLPAPGPCAPASRLVLGPSCSTGGAVGAEGPSPSEARTGLGRCEAPSGGRLCVAFLCSCVARVSRVPVGPRAPSSPRGSAPPAPAPAAPLGPPAPRAPPAPWRALCRSRAAAAQRRRGRRRGRRRRRARPHCHWQRPASTAAAQALMAAQAAVRHSSAARTGPFHACCGAKGRARTAWAASAECPAQTARALHTMAAGVMGAQ